MENSEVLVVANYVSTCHLTEHELSKYSKYEEEKHQKHEDI